MKTYISFGQDHRHDINGVIFDKDCIAAIECETSSEGRDIAFKVFGPKFCFQYDNLESVGLHRYHRGVIELRTDNELK